MRYTPSPKERALYPVHAGVMYFPDGVELCITDEAYKRRTEELAARQQWICAICTRLMGYPTFDHEEGRGLGGSRQDDRIENADGSWHNASLCVDCNSTKGSKRYTWVGRNYVPVIA